MNSPKLILSFQKQSVQGFEQWFDTALASIEEIRKVETNSFIEIPIERHGRNGIFADNPPLDELDVVLQQFLESDSPLGSILLPVNINQTEENIGIEISAIDGWADLASYAGIELARFRILSPDAMTQEYVQKALSITIGYMNDQDIAVALDSSGDTGMLSNIVEQQKSIPDRKCGLNSTINIDNLEPPASLPITETISVSLASPFSSQTVLDHFSRICNMLKNPVHAIVFEIEQ